jgi:galactonate dehydratase
MPKITLIETVIARHLVPNLLLLRIHTDDGLIGHGETYYTPEAIAALIHDWMAERLLGADALAIESHWRFLYERCTPFGAPGAEMRALSAVDVALWDIAGQATGQPVYRLLGGPVRNHIPVYNTCGGPTYGAASRVDRRHPGWPGYGDTGKPGQWEDNWAFWHTPGELAESLVAEGFHGMKVWPFDRFAQQHGGGYLSWDEIEQGMRPLREIRQRVGKSLEIMIEGHAFFLLPAALRLAAALREIEPLWLEDVLRVDNIATLAEFRRRSGMPVAASEMLLGRREFLELLKAQAADFVMVDPTWSGGISETRRIVELAEAHNVPVTLHDCTGPITWMAGLHLAAALPNVTFQETVRAHVHTFYHELVDTIPPVEKGFVGLPPGPGLGTRWLPELFSPENTSYRRSPS